MLSSLRREVREETGLEIGAPTLRAVIVADEGKGPGVLIFVYVAHSAGRQVRPSAEGELLWAPLAELERLDLVADLHDLLPRILDGGTDIVYGHYAPDGTRTWRQ